MHQDIFVLLRKSPICKPILDQTDEYPQRKERKKNLKHTFKYLHLKTKILSFAQKNILKNNEILSQKNHCIFGSPHNNFP